MKNVRFRSTKMTLAVLICMAAMASAVLAHDMWIEAIDYTPGPEEKIAMILGYDHYFPARVFLQQDYLDRIFMLTPKGDRIEIKIDSDGAYKTEKALSHEGTHMVAAFQKGRFWTKTTEGYQRGKSKEGLENVIECSYSEKYGKAIVHHGTASGELYAKPLGHALEIVPLADPGALRIGDRLPVEVLFRKKPLSGAQVLATYVGFSREKNTFAYATKTDASGKARIRLSTPGAWLVTAHHKAPYTDPSVCDQYSYAASLTFEIQ